VDRRTLVAIALCIVFLLLYPQLLKWAGLSRYLERPHPAAVAPADSARRDSLARAAARGALPADSQYAATAKPGAVAPAISAAPLRLPHAAIERSVRIETPLYNAVFSTRGARLVSLELKHFATAPALARDPKLRHHKGDVPEGARVTLDGGPTFGLDLGSAENLRSLADVSFAERESLDAAGEVRAVTFTATDASGLAVRETYRVRPQDYALELEVEVGGAPLAARVSDYSLTLRSWPLVTEANQQADEHMLRATSLVGTNVHREPAASMRKGPRAFDGNAAWAAVQTRYFLAAVAIVNGSARGVLSSADVRTLDPVQIAELGPKAGAEQNVAVNSLIVGLPTADHPVHRFVLYFGPSQYFRLASLKLQLERAVDLGWNWILPFSRALLQLMNWLYALLRNYGLAILALATLVRVVLHPLNMSSMKSMRAMQKLQPEIERIRAKHKNDAQAMNTAIMALYKENKVNPAGGCLPMLLQMPLFLALYQVLFNASELRQAPFVAWMQDLSAPDLLFTVAGFPIRLLPVLMAGSGLLQQKLSPTDPRQQTSMYMMNVMMLVFFYSLPSGLVLYWTVMNLLTALQQWLILRQDGGVAMPAVAAPPSGPGKARAAGR
jgi:YidC/Oxa1 family membrane protein insertase